MSGLGILRVALFFGWAVSFFACVCFFFYKKRRIALIAGLMSVLSLAGWALLGSNRSREVEQSLAQRAAKKIRECKALGERPFVRSDQTLIWDLSAGNADPTGIADLFRNMDPRPVDEPLTVFLVSPEQSSSEGTYSISGMPGFREWFEVYVVQFRNFSDDGTALGMHEFVSSAPIAERPVSNRPEYGPFSTPQDRDENGREINGPSKPNHDRPKPPPVEDWVNSLPTH